MSPLGRSDALTNLVTERPDTSTVDAAALVAHGPVLLAVARTMAGNEADAQDLVQVTFEIALRNLSSLRKPDATRAWLLRIEVREAMRFTRRLRRLVSLEGTVRDIGADDPAMSDRIALRQAIRRLPLRIRAAIALHHLAGMTVRETADALGVTENTIKTELKAGLARLRSELGHG